MPNSEKENNEWTLRKTMVRVFAYLFCAFLLWYGVSILTSSPLTPKDYLRGIGVIVAACVYVCVDLSVLRSKNKRPNR